MGDGIREEGVVRYGGGSVIDPKLEGDGHTYMRLPRKSLEGEGRLRALTLSAGLYISQHMLPG